MGSRRVTGAIDRLPSGRWRARWRTADGRRISSTWRTKADADAWLAEQAHATRMGVGVDWSEARRVTFGEWAERWLERQGHLRPKTLTGYASVIRGRLTPALGRLHLAQIDREIVEDFLSALVNSGLAPGTVREARKVMSMVLQAAVEARLLAVNPAAGLRIGRGRREEMRFLDHAEVEALAEAIAHPHPHRGGHGAAPWWRTEHPELGLLVRFAAYTGLRAAEIAGLRVGDLDLASARVTVRRTLAEVAGHGLVEGPTKTARQRSVPMPRFLVEALREHTRDKAEDDFVFQSPEGGPLRHRNFYARHFIPAARQAGLDGLRFHDLRHTYAAFLIAAGAHPRAIMERMGHSSVTVTLGVYGHLFPHLEEALTADLERSRTEALGSRLGHEGSNTSRSNTA